MNRNIYYTTALCAVALLCVGGASRAQLVSSLTSSIDNGLESHGVEQAAGQFTLTSAATVGSATLSLYDDSHGSSLSDLTAALFTDSANLPGSLIATSTGSTGSLVQYATHPVTFTFSNPGLSAGNYWLELIVAPSSDMIWNGNDTSLTNTGTDGIVDLQSYSSVFGAQPIGLMFSIDAPLSESSTPEPGPMALLGGFGLAGLAAARRRRK